MTNASGGTCLDDPSSWCFYGAQPAAVPKIPQNITSTKREHDETIFKKVAKRGILSDQI